MGAVTGEASGRDSLVVRSLVPPQALTCPHLPHLHTPHHVRCMYCNIEWAVMKSKLTAHKELRFTNKT